MLNMHGGKPNQESEGVMALMVWMIGWGFCIGLMLEESKSKEGFTAAMILLFMWPLCLGGMVRELVDATKGV